MLANVLKSETAIKMSLRIIGLFVRLREMLLGNKDILHELEELEKRSSVHSREIRQLFEIIRELLHPPVPSRRRLGFKGGD